MENIENIVTELRKRGLSNGSSLGWHSGLMDEAADVIEQLQTEVERLTGYNENLRYANQDILYKLETEIAAARTKAIDEFTEKLKKKAKPHYFDNCHYAIPVNDLDEIAEEMKNEQE